MLTLHQECILLNLQATNKEGVLEELTQLAVQHYNNLDEQQLLATLLEREQIGSTGVGNGVAIPHGKMLGLEEIIFCFGRSTGGVNFEAIDNRPVFLFAMLLSPLNIASDYLKALAHVSTVLKEQQNRIMLLQDPSPKDVVSLFTPPEKNL
ncbi:MAG: PTS fructose transporter subunit IIA [Desulfobulbus propionicus]|nr:MAG: PTS fructose transporter subunit IIA [Desulfobulbus propionicus]